MRRAKATCTKRSTSPASTTPRPCSSARTIGTPSRLEKKTAAETLAQKAIAAGIDGIRVDGNDVLGVYRVAREAIENARNGEPTLIEALTYRRSMHTTSDDPTAYREREEEEKWEARDPIVRFKVFLEDRGVLDEKTEADITDRVESDVAEAIDRAKEERETVDPADMFRYAYAEMPNSLERQLESFGGETDG